MSHSQRNVGILLIKLYFSYVIKVLYFFSNINMDLLIYVSFLGHSRCKENGPFVRNTIYKFQPHITLFTKYLALDNN